MYTSTFGTSVNRRTAIKGLAGLGIAAAGLGLGLSLDRTPALAEDKGEEAKTQTVTDMEGTEVTMPYDLQNVAITSWKGSIGSFVLLGHADKIKICCSCERYRWLCHAIPELATLPNYGSFNDINVEEMFQANPDVVISPAAASDATEKMRDLGLTVFVDGTNPKDASDVFATQYEELEAAAAMLHEEEKLQSYFDWNEKLMQEVEDRVADIAEEDKKRVLVVRSNMEEVFCANISLGHTVTLAGGKLVTDEMNEYYTQVDTEQVISWNPEVIFQQIVTVDQDTVTGLYNEWSADQRYMNMPAIQTGDVYIMPMGITQWGGDIESGLGMLLIGKLLYPERFEDMDVLEYATEFYKTFMNYELGEEDYAYLFRDMEGAKSLGVVPEKDEK